MDCDKCKTPMKPVGLGCCNGWECPTCKATKSDIASFKLGNGREFYDWEKSAIKLIGEGKLRIFYNKAVPHPEYIGISMFKCRGCKLPVENRESWFFNDYQWHYNCFPKEKD